ncbi:DUF2933 domain-containing protein [Neobacillus cucumis]|uniref:DUF2933 domain-containing protein n=1 Tax=Neobacillus cucumis TaxID=1740721 RepID=UPI0018E00DAB|nr:DUF2933 domain-containing protein [Neobacillus cucumis]MBI0579798.1 DUF2933 domain-containing protein [Neobacillus cucumis]
MQWLLLLLCPLMILFCMKGMHKGSYKEGHTKHFNNQSNEIKSLQMQLLNLQEQNRQLADEVRSLKNLENQKIITLTKAN